MFRISRTSAAATALGALALALVACAGPGASADEEGLPPGAGNDTEQTRLADGEPGASIDPNWSDTVDYDGNPIAYPVDGQIGMPAPGYGDKPDEMIVVDPGETHVTPRDEPSPMPPLYDGGQAPTEPSPGAPGYEVIGVPAEIEGVFIDATKSIPAQYFVRINVALPGGCAKLGGYTMTQDGNEFVFRVTTLVPASGDIACTKIMGYAEISERLEGTVPGETYVVNVNGRVFEEFVAQ